MMDDKLRVVRPYGYIVSGLERYFLLSPEPITKDSWQDNNTYRFVVVPIQPYSIEEVGKEVYKVYGYARHVVTNAFIIEYCYDMEEIHIPVIDEIDLTLQK